MINHGLHGDYSLTTIKHCYSAFSSYSYLLRGANGTKTEPQQFRTRAIAQLAGEAEAMKLTAENKVRFEKHYAFIREVA